jgi:16S rRNA (cytosine967-C5)-methyltransferase
LSRFHAYVKKAVSILEQYKGEQPFSIYCKQQFAADPRMGSTDRKLIRHYCYSYQRMGQAFSELSMENKLLAAVYLLSPSPDPLIAALRPDWLTMSGTTLQDRIASLPISFSWNDIFAHDIALSASLQKEEWIQSHFTQPDLFIRLRPHRAAHVLQQLLHAKLPYNTIDPTCLSFSAATSLASLATINSDYVIQDYSSQQIGQLLSLLPTDQVKKVWDCCAASGGKSILAVDTLPGIQLTVSDVRHSILTQLKNRFRQAAIKGYQSFELNLEKENDAVPSHFLFDLVIADVPCSGSGTWSRTPEQLSQFSIDQLDFYCTKQKRILANLPKTIRKGGYLLYSTCSVFNLENEKQVEAFASTHQFTIVKMQLFKGIAHKADSLFGALLQKN